jgi:hypothetical protein
MVESFESGAPDNAEKFFAALNITTTEGTPSEAARRRDSSTASQVLVDSGRLPAVSFTDHSGNATEGTSHSLQGSETAGRNGSSSHATSETSLKLSADQQPAARPDREASAFADKASTHATPNSSRGLANDHPTALPGRDSSVTGSSAISGAITSSTPGFPQRISEATSQPTALPGGDSSVTGSNVISDAITSNKPGFPQRFAAQFSNMVHPSMPAQGRESNAHTAHVIQNPRGPSYRADGGTNTIPSPSESTPVPAKGASENASVPTRRPGPGERRTNPIYRAR